MQAIRNYKYKFGRHLYYNDETNPILGIRLVLYCRIFEELKSSVLTVADVLSLHVVDASHFDVGFILYFCSADTRTQL
jgi:hypothetical protein